MPKLRFLSYAYWRSRLSLLIALFLLIVFVVCITGSILSFSLNFKFEQAFLQETDLRISTLAPDGAMPFEDALMGFSSIETASPFLYRESYLKKASGQAINVFGVDPELYTESRNIVSGRSLDKYDARSIVVSNSLAERLALERLDTVWLATPEGFKDFIVTGIVNEELDLVVIPIAEVQLAFTSGLAFVNGYDLELKTHANAQDLAIQLQSEFPNTSLMHQNKLISSSSSSSGLVVALLLSLGLLALLASSYLYLSFLSLLKLERLSDLRVLQGLGMNIRALKAYLIYEISVIVGAALIAGTIAAHFLTHAIFWVFQDYVYSFSSLATQKAFYGTELTIALGLVTTVFFLLTTNSMSRLELHSVPKLHKTTKSNAHWRLTLGQYVNKRLNHSTLTLLANRFWLSQKLLAVFQKRERHAFLFLSLSLTSFVALFGLAQSFQGSTGAWLQPLEHWDLIVTQRDDATGVSVPFSEDVQDTLLALPGVSAVASDFKMSIYQGDLKANLFISDGFTKPMKSIEGVASEVIPNALKTGRKIVVAESLATLYNLGPESSLTLNTPTGQQTYDVIAVVDDRGAEPRGIFIDRAQYTKDWQLNRADQYTVSVKNEADSAMIARLIKKELSSDYLINVASVPEVQAESRAVISKPFGLGKSLAIIFIAMSILSLINIIAERLPLLRKDLKILKALGAPNLVLRQVLLGKLLLNTCLSIGFGLTLGTAISYWSVQLLKYSGRFTIAWYWPSSSYLSFLVLSILSVAFAMIIADKK